MYSLIVVPMIILVAVGASPADVRAQGSSGPLVTFVAAAESLATSLHLPGLSVAVVQEQEMAWSGGFGFADLEQRVPAAGDTPYRLASLSKPLASLLLMMLVEEGTLDLDARMADFVIHPWFEPGGDPGRTIRPGTLRAPSRCGTFLPTPAKRARPATPTPIVGTSLPT